MTGRAGQPVCETCGVMWFNFGLSPCIDGGDHKPSDQRAGQPVCETCGMTLTWTEYTKDGDLVRVEYECPTHGVVSVLDA